MNVRILTIAQKEFNEAKEYYEVEQTSLGNKFKIEIVEGIRKINQFPNAWPTERPEIRRYILYKFPYKILYSVQNNEIVVLAFAHVHRNPAYWIDRISEL